MLAAALSGATSLAVGRRIGPLLVASARDVIIMLLTADRRSGLSILVGDCARSHRPLGAPHCCLRGRHVPVDVHPGLFSTPEECWLRIHPAVAC